MEKIVTTSDSETMSLGRKIMTEIEKGAFVALYGDLGAGKTALVKGMVSSFLPDAIVTSPTYNIVNTYSDGEISFHHFDMYRITDEDDLYSVGFFDISPDDFIVAEWCENIPWAIPDKYLKITITKDPTDFNVRYIEMEFIDNADSRS